MKLAILGILSMILLFGTGTAYACSVLDKEEARMGVKSGFRGECSNSGYTITCFLEQGSWVNCSSPRGSASGTNLRSLIYAACGCNDEDERRRNLEEQMFDY